MTTTVIFLYSLLGLLYLAFLFWYGGRGKPLSQEEVERTIQEIRHRAGKHGEVDEGLLEELKQLTQSDDGNEFYMVNLMKFREKALYPEGYDYDDDAMAANGRYTKHIIPALLRFGGHPVMLGDVQGRFLHPEDAMDWDQVGVIRYRSRRDMLKMVLSISDKPIGVHKWASMEKTHVFPIKPLISLTFLRLFAFFGLFGSVGLVQWLLGGS